MLYSFESNHLIEVDKLKLKINSSLCQQVNVSFSFFIISLQGTVQVCYLVSYLQVCL